MSVQNYRKCFHVNEELLSLNKIKITKKRTFSPLIFIKFDLAVIQVIHLDSYTVTFKFREKICVTR